MAVSTAVLCLGGCVFAWVAEVSQCYVPTFFSGPDWSRANLDGCTLKSLETSRRSICVAVGLILMEQPCIAPLLGVSLNVISILTPPLKTPGIGFHGQLSEVKAQQGKPQFSMQEPEPDRLVSLSVTGS